MGNTFFRAPGGREDSLRVILGPRGHEGEGSATPRHLPHADQKDLYTALWVIARSKSGPLLRIDLS
jgi:hypothetical protein